MKTRIFGAVVAAGLLGLGCAAPPASGGASANGSLAVTHDDALLYAADSDLDAVLVVDTRTDTRVATIAVGKQPEKVLIGPDDTVFVTNRLGRSVSVLRRGDSAEAARLEVGVEPVGLALSANGKTLYVVNATARTDTEFGTLMAFDTATLQQQWELPVGPEPRAIALLDGDRAAITLYKRGDLVLVDLKKQVAVKDGTGLYDQLNRNALGLADPSTGGAARPPLPGPFGGVATVQPHALEAIVPSQDGRQLFVPALLGSDQVIQTRTQGNVNVPTDPTIASGGYGAGACGASVATPALLTFDADGTPQVDDAQSCGAGTDTTRPPTVITTNMPGAPIQGPAALALDPTGGFIFIANRSSNNVSVVPVGTRESPQGGKPVPGIDVPVGFSVGGTVRDLVTVGAGPTGIAVSHDGKRAWTWNAFDHSVTRIEQLAGGRLSNVATTRLADDVLPADVVAGRKLFFSAVDVRMNNPGTGISCATCHLEGREDGHVWNFSDGPRQTPALAGRALLKTAPFHWSGEFPDLMAFMSHTVTERMGGTGVTPEMEGQVAAYLTSLPAPDNAARTSTGAEVVARGRAAFEKAGCQQCHAGEALTDNGFANVGTLVTTGAVRDDLALLPKGLNTPSLLGVGRSAPYLHDGSMPTLKARLVSGKSADLHGHTSLLSDAEVDDLVSYLKTL